MATGGLLGGILASSCCILPLAFVSLGISGAWIGRLTALSPYQPQFLAAALIFLGAGFWKAYQPKEAARAPDSLCAKSGSRWMTKVVLWAGAAITLASFSVNLLSYIG